MNLLCASLDQYPSDFEEDLSSLQRSNVETAVVQKELNIQSLPESEESESAMDAVTTIKGNSATQIDIQTVARATGHDVSNMYQPCDSIYDAMLYVFMALQGDLGSLYVVLLLILNLVVQGVFIWVILNNIESPFTDVQLEAFRLWRTNVAHDLRNMDPTTLVSLATRVCHIPAHSGLEFSTEQAQVVVDIHEYLDGYNGIFLCSLSTFCWFLLISEELRSATGFLSALRYLAVSKEHTEIIFDPTRGEIAWLSMTRHRCRALCVVALVRILYACSLGYVGTRFLVYTRSLEDLILNAVALEFILNIDELIYAALAPARTKCLIALTKPISFKGRSALKVGGLGTYAMVTFTCVIIAFSIVVPRALWPEHVARVDALQELCPYDEEHGPMLDERREVDAFVFGRNKMGVGIWSNSVPYEDAKALKFQETWIKVLTERKLHPPKDVDRLSELMNGARMSSINGPLNSMYQLTELPADVVTTYLSASTFMRSDPENSEPGGHAGCHDVKRSDRKTTQIYKTSAFSELGMARGGLGVLSDALGVSVTDCADVVPWCHRLNIEGVRARQWCPATCGCNRLYKGFFTHVFWGCPANCPYHPRYQADRLAAPCEDTRKGSPTWASWLENADMFQNFTDAEFVRSLAYAVGTDMKSFGCDVIARYNGTTNLCFADDILGGRLIGKMLRSWCPVTCECPLKIGALDCPATCNGTKIYDPPYARRPQLKPGIPEGSQSPW